MEKVPSQSIIPYESSPSPYIEKVASAQPNYLLNMPATSFKPETYKPTWYFFYGTLARPDTLRHILGLQTSPAMRKAQVEGYSLAMWGQYRALIDGPQRNIVRGSAFLVATQDEDRLAYYETNAYEIAPCVITFTDDAEPRSTRGNTFIYAGDASAIQAGRFDRSLWEKQMGISLPKKWNRQTSS